MRIGLVALVIVLGLAPAPAAAQDSDIVIKMAHDAQEYTTNGCLSSAGTATFTISPPVPAARLPTEAMAKTDEGHVLHASVTWEADAGADMLVWQQYMPASVVELRFVGGDAIQTGTTAHMWRPNGSNGFQRTASVRCFAFTPLLLRK